MDDQARAGVRLERGAGMRSLKQYRTRIAIVAAATFIASGMGVWAATTNLRADVSAQNMYATYAGTGYAQISASNNVTTIDGTTTTSYWVNVNTSGGCEAWSSSSGSEPFLTLDGRASQASISAEFSGSASFDGGWTFVPGTISVEATAAASNPQQSPTVITGVLRSGNVSQRIHIDQYLSSADSGSASVLFNGAPCAAGALVSGNMDTTEQRIGVRTKN